MEQQGQTATPTQTCPDCHALVADLDGHERWHVRLVSDLANAVENEIKRTSAASG